MRRRLLELGDGNVGVLYTSLCFCISLHTFLKISLCFLNKIKSMTIIQPTQAACHLADSVFGPPPSLVPSIALRPASDSLPRESPASLSTSLSNCLLVCLRLSLSVTLRIREKFYSERHPSISSRDSLLCVSISLFSSLLQPFILTLLCS